MKRINIKNNPLVITAILFILGSAFSMLSIQFLILDWEDFQKTSLEMLFINGVCCMILYLAMLVVTDRPGISAVISHIILMVFAYTDYFVYEFRGNEFTFADIKAAGTGLSVASSYQFHLSGKCIGVLLASIVYIVICYLIKTRFPKPYRVKIIGSLLIVLSTIVVILNATGMDAETWEKKGSYKNGYLLNFALQIRDSFVKAPEGYSAEVVKEITDQYSDRSSEYSQAEVEHPTIIAIMNESFCDLSVIGDFKTNIPVTPYLNSMRENVIKGYALSSVYGAKTPNSEWEYLSGSSMANLPNGSVVYQQYMNKNPNTLVSTLKNEGYTCVAMHPYYETGWSRNSVYPNMGFDEMHFIDDFDQDNILREYISDEEMYNQIINRFEKKGQEDLFIFGVTMQNHGGYNDDYDNFEEKVYKIGTSYTDANQYLSLIHESDQALSKLISYFEQVDEPVEIVFFGDHQPGLYSKFYGLLNGKGVSGLTLGQLENMYTVPFFVWTNYQTETKDVDITSINYLSTLTLERANIDLPVYNQFLADMMEEIPAINPSGYYSKENGKFIHNDEATGIEADWLERYRMLQYNSMFDKKGRSSRIFPFIEGDQQ